MSKPVTLAAAALAGIGQEPARLEDDDIRRVFSVMHGYYGNLFTSKFATGGTTQAGEDEGIANAKRIWAYGLRDYSADTIKTALRRVQTHHPEFPPSLPQFLALCEAIRPRPVYQPPAPAQPALEMSEELRAERRERAIAAAREAVRKGEAEPASGLDLLKQAVASAVGAAGGDEAAALMRLDRELAGLPA